MRKVLGITGALVLVAVGAFVADGTGAGAGNGGGNDKAGRYIVVLEDGSDAGSVAAEHGRRFGVGVGAVYSHALKGYAGTMSSGAAAKVAGAPGVAYVEADQTVTVSAPKNSGGDVSAAAAQVVPWGIDRVDADVSSTLAGNGSGSVVGVTVFVIDTGVAKHPDLNVVGHVNRATGKNSDCHGHGTHVAGTVGAKDNTTDVVGVAPGVRIFGVKVLGCNGSGWMSDVIEGIDYVTASTLRPAVANMSLGGGISQATDDAVRRSVAAGVTYAIAAGNSGADACNSSPARAGTTNGVITVAATDSANAEASWSNYGSCVDIWAPGVGVVSTKLTSGLSTKSGTSMASPHVAGGAALYRSRTVATPAQVEAAVKTNAATPGTTSKDSATIKLLRVATF
jgi:hypothetical protein